MRKGEVKFWHFIFWLIVSVTIFSLIFVYIRLYSRQDTINSFIPRSASYYLHVDVSNYEKNQDKNNLVNEMMAELNFGPALSNKILLNIDQEVALTYVPEDGSLKKYLFIRTLQIHEVTNLLDIAQKPYKKISSRLLVVGENKITLEFKSAKNQLFTKLNQIQFAGDMFYWGFIKKELFQNSLARNNPGLKEYISETSERDEILIFTSQLEKGRLKFRLGKIEEVQDDTLLESLNNGSQIQDLKPLIAKLDPATSLSIVIDDLSSLKDYMSPEYFDMITVSWLERFRVEADILINYQNNKSQLNIINKDNKKYFLLALQADQEKGHQDAGNIEQALKNIIALTFLKEEAIILPDKTRAIELIAPLKKVTREEEIFNQYKIVIFKLPEELFQLAYAFAADQLLIGNSSKTISNSLVPNEGQLDFNELIDQRFSWSGKNIIYLHGSFLKQLPLAIFPLNYENLLLTSVEKRFFNGFEGCFY